MVAYTWLLKEEFIITQMLNKLIDNVWHAAYKNLMAHLLQITKHLFSTATVHALGEKNLAVDTCLRRDTLDPPLTESAACPRCGEGGQTEQTEGLQQVQW